MVPETRQLVSYFSSSESNDYAEMTPVRQLVQVKNTDVTNFDKFMRSGHSNNANLITLPTKSNLTFIITKSLSLSNNSADLHV